MGHSPMHSDSGTPASLSENELLSALHLARKWQMGDIFHLVVETIWQREEDLARKAALGLQHHVEDWAVPALKAICYRATPFLSESEGHTFGMSTVIKLVNVRELSRKNYSHDLGLIDLIRRAYSIDQWDT